jgi:hypothetical protein
MALSALANDVGLIRHLTGDVSYLSGTADKAKPFMMLREGERLNIARGAHLRWVYFQGGRQETGAQPQVSTLPSGVPQKISQTPELVQIAKLGRSGGVAARGLTRDERLTPQQQAEVREARQTYEQLRQSAPADDITPELYLYSQLQDHLLFNDMKGVVSEMQRRQPGDPDVAVMVEYVKVKTEAL